MSDPDFARLPEMGAGLFTAPLKRPAHVGEDWLEPAQHAYTAGENAIWDELYARQMQVLPGRAASEERHLICSDRRMPYGRAPGTRRQAEQLSQEAAAISSDLLRT